MVPCEPFARRANPPIKARVVDIASASRSGAAPPGFHPGCVERVDAYSSWGSAYWSAFAFTQACETVEPDSGCTEVAERYPNQRCYDAKQVDA